MKILLTSIASKTIENVHFAKKPIVFYGGRAIAKFQHLLSAMLDVVKVTFAMTAIYRGGEYLDNRIARTNKISVTSVVSLTNVCMGLFYTAILRSKINIDSVVISLFALRTLEVIFPKLAEISLFLKALNLDQKEVDALYTQALFKYNGQAPAALLALLRQNPICSNGNMLMHFTLKR